MGTMIRRSSLAQGFRGLAMFVALLGVSFAAAPAEAQDYVSLYDQWQVSASLTSAILNTKIRIDSERLGVGTELDAEDDLGLEKTKLQPRASFRWRPGRKHELEGGFQFAERSAEKQLERTITVGDTTFDAGADIGATLNTNQAFLTYRYAILAKERSQVGAGLGIGTIFLGAGVDAFASAANRSVTHSSEGSILAPFGALGVYGRVLSGERWQFEGDARVLKAEIDRFTAKVVDVSLAARYFTSRKFGIEAGVGSSAIDVDIAPKDSGFFGGHLEYSLTNVRLGVVYVP
jgi:hypothetical protein